MKNRAIEFRAWDKNTKSMISPEMLFINDESDSGTSSLNSTINSLQSNGFVLMQFVGILDKKGKKCYENDIIICNELYHQRSFKTKQYKAVVKYNITGYIPLYIENINFGLNFNDFEIIGNIFENPIDIKNEFLLLLNKND